MKKISTKPERFFNIIASTDKSQLAEMVLEQGQTTDGPNNRYEISDQWLVVEAKPGLTLDEKSIEGEM